MSEEFLIVKRIEEFLDAIYETHRSLDLSDVADILNEHIEGVKKGHPELLNYENLNPRFCPVVYEDEECTIYAHPVVEGFSTTRYAEELLVRLKVFHDKYEYGDGDKSIAWPVEEWHEYEEVSVLKSDGLLSWTVSEFHDRFREHILHWMWEEEKVFDPKVLVNAEDAFILGAVYVWLTPDNFGAFRDLISEIRRSILEEIRALYPWMEDIIH